ncbi:MAG: SpoIIE family protein phosphatase [Oscillospiraceae bacterium]|nr:SpoIIE family protein phosphatase [Oscillospiraceae bacterium]
MSKEFFKKKSSFSLFRETALSFLCGLIFSCAQLGSIASPIPVAAAVCTGCLGSVSVLLGAIVTGFISGSFLSLIPLLISLMLAACVRIFLREWNSSLFVSVSASLCVFAAGMVYSFAQNKSAEGILVSVMSAFLTGTTAYFLSTVLASFNNQKKIHLKSSVGCAAAVVYFVLISALFSFEYSTINPGYIIGVAVTLIAAQRFRYCGGVICGALTACGAMLSAEELGMSLVFLPVTGLLAGYMTEKGSFVASGVFFLFNALAQLTIQNSFTTYSSIGNLMLGCIVYLLLHTICLDKWLVADEPASDRMMENMALRLRFMAASISSVRADTEKISELLSHSAYESKYKDKQLAYALCSTGTEGKASQKKTQDIPYEHEKSRIKLQREKTARKTESRHILFEQLIASEKMLASFGESMSVRYSSELTDAIERRLDSCGYYCDSVAAYFNQCERLVIELYSQDSRFEENMSSVCRVLSEMLGTDFLPPEKAGTKNSVRFCLCQASPYHLKSYSAKRCAENGDVSGDTTLLFRDSSGSVYAVLSDGMGTGRSAAVESRMTAEMFRKLVGSGISCDAAIRIINGLMLTKSEQESFATLDTVCFDPDSCEVTLIKSGAASTIIRQGDRVVSVSAPTFPIGSAASADVFTKKISLAPGDIVVMLSDGVPESQYPFIKKMLLTDGEIKDIADDICRKSVIFGGGRCRDDVSVTVLQLCRRGE